MLVDLQFKAIFARTVVTAIAVDAVMLAARVSHVALICICREKAKRKKSSLTQHSKCFSGAAWYLVRMKYHAPPLNLICFLMSRILNSTAN